MGRSLTLANGFTCRRRSDILKAFWPPFCSRASLSKGSRGAVPIEDPGGVS
ncbi:MAG: hypothetical protein QXY01_05125 [Candidatus Bathyarchaeia archaeon]